MAQIVLIAILGSYGFFDPKQDIVLISGLSLLFAFASATQDIVIDAYRREILTDNQLGLGNSIHVNAYRVAGLIPGGLSLALADHMSWESVFIITSAFLLPGLLITVFFSDEKVFLTLSKSFLLVRVFTVRLV